MALDRQPGSGPGVESRREDIERVETRIDSEASQDDDPWRESDEDRDQDAHESSQAIREHLAENPRNHIGRHSDAGPPHDDEPRAAVTEQQAEEPAETADDSETDDRLTELRVDGHGPQRHLDARNDQLRDRMGTAEVGPDGKPVLKPNGEVKARDHIDPMTGTTVDGVTGRRHRCGDVATAFSDPKDFVAAEAYLRAKALTDGRRRPEATIEEVLGKEAEQRMRGFRHDPESAGSLTDVDFDGGSIKALYKPDANGDLRCVTMYPVPAPKDQS